MFAKMKNGHAKCLQAYKDIQEGAIVPPVNELWSQVQEWSDSNGGLPDYDNSADTVSKAKEAKRSEIRSAFTDASEEPIQHIGINWHGGFDSAIKLDAAHRLAETAGLTETVFYDTNNLGHALSLQDAKSVIIQVSKTYQEILAKKQGLMRQVDLAETPEQVGAVQW